MKRLLQRSTLIIWALSAVLCTRASAQYLQLRLVSSANVWQQQDTIGQTSSHVFGYQTAQLSLAGENMSFHTYLQGFNDFAGPLKNNGFVRFYNFYLKYANVFDMVDISLGRQAVFAGVGNGTIDGGVASVRLLDSQLKVLGYYGALPSPEQKFEMNSNPGDNNMFGAQLIAMPKDNERISFSYMKKSLKPETYWAMRKDSLFNPALTEISPSASSEEYVSGDINFDFDRISAYARSDYDLNQEQISRIQFFTRLKVAEPLSVTGEYLHREPRLSYNSIFWVFAYNTISEYDIGAEYAICTDWQVFGKFGSISYGDDHSNQLTVGGSMKYASASFSWNSGYSGELAAFSVNAGYPLCDNQLTPTILISYAHYKLSSGAPLSDALSGAVGAVYRPIPALSLDVQLQGIQNKVYSNDVRLFLRGSYYIGEQLNIF
jgi:hypothetical protein